MKVRPFPGRACPPDREEDVYGKPFSPAEPAAEFARAALESVGYQTSDLLEAMRADWPDHGEGNVLRVDGGMTASDWTM